MTTPVEAGLAARPVTVGAGSAEVTSGPCLLVGWSLRETTGAAAAVARIVDGGGPGGQLVASIGLASGASDSGPGLPVPIYCPTGLYFQLVAGAVEGAVWVVPL